MVNNKLKNNLLDLEIIFDPISYAYSEKPSLETRGKLLELFKFGINIAGITYFHNGQEDDFYKTLIIDYYQKNNLNVNIYLFWSQYVINYLNIKNDTSLHKFLNYRLDDIIEYLELRFPKRFIYNRRSRVLYDLLIPVTLDQKDSNFNDFLRYRMSRVSDIDRFIKYNKIDWNQKDQFLKTSQNNDSEFLSFFERERIIDQVTQLRPRNLGYWETNKAAESLQYSYKNIIQNFTFEYFTSDNSNIAKEINDLASNYFSFSSTVTLNTHPEPVLKRDNNQIFIRKEIRDQLYKIIKTQFDYSDHLNLWNALADQKTSNDERKLHWKYTAKTLTEIFGYLHQKGMVNNTKDQIANFIKTTFSFNHGGKIKNFVDSTLWRNLQKTDFNPFPFEEIEFLVKEIKSR